MIIKHYAEVRYPGGVTSIHLVPDRRVMANSHRFSESYAFRLFDRVEIKMEDGGVFEGERKNQTGWYYHGTKLTQQDVINRFGDDPNYKHLIYMMKLNDYFNVAETTGGLFLLGDYDDVIIHK